MIKKTDYFGDPLIGMFAVTNNDITFIPRDAPDNFREALEPLGTDIIEASIYNSKLLGLFSAMNDKGIVLPGIAYSPEIEAFREYLDIVIIEEYTAIGNLISLNDNHAIVSPKVPRKYHEEISEKLGVKVIVEKLDGFDVTGSLIAMNNKGFVLTSLATDEDLKRIEKELKIEGRTTTLNYGIPFVKSSIIANDKGAVVGNLSTPFELGRVDEAMFLR